MKFLTASTVLKGSMAVALIASVLALSGCSETPLDSLKKTAYSKKFDNAFWSDQARLHTALWKPAKTFCRTGDHVRLPNCMVVNQIAFFSDAMDEANAHVAAALKH